MKKENIGSSFDDWLHEEGIYKETSAAAIKRVLARKISHEMTEQESSGSEVAKHGRAAHERGLYGS
jgi:hypothetical protein